MKNAKVFTIPTYIEGGDSSRDTSHTIYPWRMSGYPRVYTHSKNWNGNRNGVIDRRRRRIQNRNAEFFPWSHGRKLCPERALGGLPNHENLNNKATLGGVKCTGAPVYTGPREVSNGPRSVRNGHPHHQRTNYRKSANSTTAPSQIGRSPISSWNSDQTYGDQHVSLRSNMWNGSRPWAKRDNRLITPFRWIANEHYTSSPGLEPECQIRMGYPQPFMLSRHKESIQNANRMEITRRDTTGDNNNDGVVPIRTEGFNNKPARYINSEDRRHLAEGLPGWKAFPQLERNDQQKVYQCVPMGLDNPWGLGKQSYGYSSIKGDWDPSNDYVGFAETNNHGPRTNSTTNLADNNLSNQTSSEYTLSHRHQVCNRQSAGKMDHSKSDSTLQLNTMSRASKRSDNYDSTWKGIVHSSAVVNQPHAVEKNMNPEAAVPSILPRTIQERWPTTRSEKDTDDLLRGLLAKERSSSRTSISVLQERPGSNGPQWRKLHTDQTAGNLFKVETVLGPDKTPVGKTETMGEWPYRMLNPNAKCFNPSTVEVTMMTDVEPGVGENKGQDQEKGEKKEPPIVWNLKGRSIDDILVDLEALKNDPEIPMPVIEADLAPVEDFEQYTRILKEEDCEENGREEEISIDAKCLEQLKLLTSQARDRERPNAFPAELWRYVLDDQKQHVKRRWEGYETDSLPKIIEQFLSELQVSDERPYAKPYFVAQALANLDRFVVKSKDGVPPLIHDRFTHRMELLPGVRARKELSQRFSETQNAFLRAKLSILEEQGRIKLKEGLRKDDWLHRLVLVEHPTRMAAFRQKYGDNAQNAMNDLKNRYEVSQLFRLTLDCREINKVLAVEPYPMPDNSMGKEHIIGSRYMSTSDAADAFYAVPIREEDFGKTGFSAIGKQWVFTVMLQGGINSARHFARIIAETFDGVPQSKILAFQDDALAHAKRLLQALMNQQLLYDRIRTNEIMLKPSKTRIAFSSCKFLGHIYTPMGRLPDPGRVECIVNMDPKPKTQKEVRHIVGLLVWNIEYIPNGMGILSYLSDLVRKDADVVAGWKPEVQGKALDLLKAALATAPCLKPIDVTRPFRVHVDACKNGRGIGAVLLQEYEGKWRPCSYFSKALTPAQRQWSATELEAYALVSAARHWERYLQNGHKWTAIVDHKALIYLVVKRTRTNNTRLLNSVMCLQGHHFDILHRNGEEHFDADAVSRILHSGDIQEAQEAVDIEDDYDKAVTMKDIRLLNRLLQLQYLAVANAKGDPDVVMPMNKDLKDYPDRGGMVKINRILRESAARRAMSNPAPIVVETNMALMDKGARLDARNIRREEGLIEAQRKAKERREHLALLRQQKQAMEREFREKAIRDAINCPTDQVKEVPVLSMENDNHQDIPSSSSSLDGDDNDHDPNEEEEETLVDGEEELVNEDMDPERVLIQTGPYRWTPTLIKEFMADYQPLEGKMLLHPRTGRLYEVGTVFFYEKLKIAAAYIRVIDGGQADPLDWHPHRIDGKGGLADLVSSFEASGGSSGSSRTPWPTSEEEWVAEQRNDPHWKDLIEEMDKERQKKRETVTPASSSSSSINENVTPVDIEVEVVHRGMRLIYNHTLMIIRSNYDGSPDRRLYIVPESLKRNVIELYHDSKGHPGASRTKDTIYLTYWWKGMSADVENHVKSCKSCARRKARNAVAAVPIQGYKAPTMPWERTHIDLTGPLTTTTLGNRYIVVMKDALTRYVETVAIRDKSAEMVVDAFIQCVVYRHGAVGTLVSDNGREFVNKLFAQVAQLLKIKHHTITEYNPRANGLAENHMRTMKDALSIYCDESQKDWDLHLNGVSAAYNTTINSQTGFTPFFMLYGREARLPSEKWLRGFGQTTGVIPYVTNVVRALTNVWDAAASTKPVELQRMREGQKPIRHLQFAEYKIGDYAMIANTPKSQNIGWVDAKFRKLNLKLQPRYSGPYLITRRLSPVVYVLQVDGFDMNVHATNMKPYVGRKTATTPYAEPGFDIYQANERVVPEPLLLSPDSTLNEKARVKFRKKNNARQKDYSENTNIRQSREQREREIRENLSATQDSLVIDDHLILDEEVIRAPVISQIASSDSADDEGDNEFTNMTEVIIHESEPTTTQWEKEFKRRAGLGLGAWERIRCGKTVRFREQERVTNTSTNPIRYQEKQLIHKSRDRKASHARRFQDQTFESPGVGTVFIPIKKPVTERVVDHPRKRAGLRSQYQHEPTTLGQRGTKLTRQVEECNLAGGEKWERNFGGTSVDLRNEESDDESSDNRSTSSEDSFDREQWHRTVLKACTNHASKLNLSVYEPIEYGFERKTVHKLRVELDQMIQIPIEVRTLWYRLHFEIRQFGKLGLLFPIMNPMLEHDDHWHNNAKGHLRNVPTSIYLRIVSLPMSVMRTLFHSRGQGRITLSTDPIEHRNHIGDPQVLQRKYDQWYWEAMRVARRMDIDPSSPRRAYSKLRGHDRKKGSAMNIPEWRSHHYFMWDAIKRNQTFREPPSWFRETVTRC